MTAIRAFLLFVIGSLLLVTIYIYQAGRRTETWPSTSGSLEVASVMKFGAGTSKQGLTDMNTDFVRYIYEAGGKQYQGSKVTIMDMPYTNIPSAESGISKIKGSTLIVRYDPADPSDSVLIAGPPYQVILTSCFILAALVALYFLLPKMVGIIFRF